MAAERMPVRIFRDSRRAAHAVARRIAQIIRQRKAEGCPAVLGLATGHTPVEVYRELIRMHGEEGLDFSGVGTFNLDEYWPFDVRAVQSYHSWMHENLFRHLNIPSANVHIPGGDVTASRVAGHCAEYERAVRQAGGIDFQILGVGRSGHIGFNEPGSPRDSRTRVVELDRITRKDAAGDFFGEEHVPRSAITMGVGTILEAREIGLLAFGEHKAGILRRAVEGEPSPQVAASLLQSHGRATAYVDVPAAAQLTRLATPWLAGPCLWDESLKRQAVLWLARKLSKPILKLTEEDYAENGLSELLRAAEGHYRLNIDVFRGMMHTITGWPGGKEAPRRVLVLSPHPDDDVICMGGTIMRLVQQGHDVRVAYMVSGYLSIFDHDVARYADFVREFNRIFSLRPQETAAVEERLEALLKAKAPGGKDAPEVRQIKGRIRRTEARDAARFCGLAEDHVRFLDMPFYDTGEVQKLCLSEKDIELIEALLAEARPDMLFAAGDMSDPHGTHRLCLEATLEALRRHEAAGRGTPEVWLYRGAWEEWPPEQIGMAVPLSPGELQAKRNAIFRHQSQKDRAMFPGPYDSREFWQRAEERNMALAAIYDKFGLPEYHALEAFAQYPLKLSAGAESQLDTEVSDR